MKYAISVREKSPETKVDTRFGRAQMFALYDTDTKQYSWHSNTQNLQAAQGAGIQTAQNVVNLGAQAVVSGHCGPKAYQVLNSADVKVYTVSGDITVEQAVEKIEAGQLKPAEGADVEGHWM
ncbi:MAG: NifB/NifX family molybdenum-iron cluster-binding protein [Candidatus Rifleibacteriota bacterium]